MGDHRSDRSHEDHRRSICRGIALLSGSNGRGATASLRLELGGVHRVSGITASKTRKSSVYVVTLTSCRHEQNDKAAYTKIDTSTKQELEVTHIDLQGLQKLHTKILRTSHAVEAASQISSAFLAHCAVNTGSNDPPLACEECSVVLRCEALDLINLNACLARLSHRLKGVSRLVCQVVPRPKSQQVLTLTVVEYPHST